MDAKRALADQFCCAAQGSRREQLPPERERATVIAPDDVEQIRVRVNGTLWNIRTNSIKFQGKRIDYRPPPRDVAFEQLTKLLWV